MDKQQFSFLKTGKKGWRHADLIDVGHGGVLDLGVGDLALVLVRRHGAVLALEDRVAVLVQLQLVDHNVGRVDADKRGGAVGLLAGDAVNVEDPPAAVDRHHLALAALEVTTDNLHLVILAHRHRAHVVLQPWQGGKG